MKRAILVTFALVLAFAAVASGDLGTTRRVQGSRSNRSARPTKKRRRSILTGVEKMVKKDKLKQAGVRFSKAAAALEKAQKQLAAVPQPPEDSAKLGKWLSGIKGEVSLMKTIAAKFKAGNKGKGSSLVGQAEEQRRQRPTTWCSPSASTTARSTRRSSSRRRRMIKTQEKACSRWSSACCLGLAAVAVGRDRRKRGHDQNQVPRQHRPGEAAPHRTGAGRRPDGRQDQIDEPANRRRG